MTTVLTCFLIFSSIYLFAIGVHIVREVLERRREIKKYNEYEEK